MKLIGRDFFDIIVDKLINEFNDVMFYRWVNSDNCVERDCLVKLTVAYERHMGRNSG